MVDRLARLSLAVCVALSLAACGRPAETSGPAAPPTEVTISSAGGRHSFHVELARSAEEQERGLMFRTNLPVDGGMLFAPYPPDGGAPRPAQFWMKNTPSPLDILFIAPDRHIIRLVENTVPFSETPIASEGAVAAVLEIRGGRAAELGISEGDTVSWRMPGK